MEILDQWGNPIKTTTTTTSGNHQSNEAAIIAQLRAENAELAYQLKMIKQVERNRTQLLKKLTKSGVLVEDNDGEFYEADSLKGMALTQWQRLGGDRSNLELEYLEASFEMYSKEQSNGQNAAAWNAKTQQEQFKAYLSSAAFLSDEKRWSNNLINMIATSGQSDQLVQLLTEFGVDYPTNWVHLLFEADLDWVYDGNYHEHVIWQVTKNKAIKIDINQYAYSEAGCGITITEA